MRVNGKRIPSIKDQRSRKQFGEGGLMVKPEIREQLVELYAKRVQQGVDLFSGISSLLQNPAVDYGSELDATEIENALKGLLR